MKNSNQNFNPKNFQKENYYNFQTYIRCDLDCPFKEEENYNFCGCIGFCEKINLFCNSIHTKEKEMIFKYRAF